MAAGRGQRLIKLIVDDDDDDDGDGQEKVKKLGRHSHLCDESKKGRPSSPSSPSSLSAGPTIQWRAKVGLSSHPVSRPSPATRGARLVGPVGAPRAARMSLASGSDLWAPPTGPQSDQRRPNKDRQWLSVCPAGWLAERACGQPVVVAVRGCKLRARQSGSKTHVTLQE